MPAQPRTPQASPEPPRTTQGARRPKPTEASCASRDAPEPDSQSIKNNAGAAKNSANAAPPHDGTKQTQAAPPAPALCGGCSDAPDLLQAAQPTGSSPSLLRDDPWSQAGWRRTGSNRRPPACKAGALPTELHPPTPSHTTMSHTAMSQTSPRQKPKHGGPGRTRTSDPTLIKRVL